MINTPVADRFFRRGREFLGCEYPILCGAMTWVSDVRLVATVSEAGGFGCLAAGNTPVHILEQQIDDVRERTAKPFAVNLITISPLYREHLAMAARKELPYIIFAGSFPREKEIQAAKATGAKVLCFASTMSIADRMRRYGADGLILEGMEAGGHVGHVTLTILLQQVLFHVDDVPVFAAGGIATGRMAAHLLTMGAAGIQLGTRFAVSEESCAHPDFKAAFLKARAREAISTPQFDSRLPVVAVRALRNRGHESFNRLQLELIDQLDRGTIRRADAQMEVERFWMGALRRAVCDGDIEEGSMMAGQSVGLVDRIMPVREIIDELVTDIEQELQRMRELLN